MKHTNGKWIEKNNYRYIDFEDDFYQKKWRDFLFKRLFQ